MTKFVIAIAVRNANSKYAKVFVGDFMQAPVLPCSYIESCLLSAQQEYPDYRIVIRDDASTDGTWETIQDMLPLFNVPVDAAQNPQRLGVIQNHYQMAQVIEDDEVIVVLDGDDQLYGPCVLPRVAREYANPQTWLTYGSFGYCEASRTSDQDWHGSAAPMGEHSRRSPFTCTHLRTYYRWLFARISEKDILRSRRRYSLIPDLALMFPMVEMAGPEHARYLPDILYLYNQVNPFNVFKGPGAWPMDTPAHIAIRQEGEREMGHDRILVYDEIYAAIEQLRQEPIYPRLMQAKEWPSL